MAHYCRASLPPRAQLPSYRKESSGRTASLLFRKLGHQEKSPVLENGELLSCLELVHGQKAPVLKSLSFTESYSAGKSSSPGEKEPLCQRGKIPSFTGAQGRSPCAEEFLFCRDRRSLFVNGKIFLNWRALLFSRSS